MTMCISYMTRLLRVCFPGSHICNIPMFNSKENRQRVMATATASDLMPPHRGKFHSSVP